MRSILGVIGALCIVALAIYLLILPAMGQASEAAHRSYCANHLHQLNDALRAYIARHGDVPRDQDGHFSLLPLTAEGAPAEYHVDTSVLSCPAGRRNREILQLWAKRVPPTPYLVNPNVTVADFSDDSMTIMVADPPGRHSHGLNMLSRSGAHFRAWSEQDRDEWARKFVAGDKSATDEAIAFPDPKFP